ncbi:MAG: tRNA preQ1(34) S-adenosylmethionine ribosyltransferase-isomerase QueA [Candidatus Omnitrophica bacterium]|nr:tRNA preQ1(34) S-adenosylmethionine ribosyltransferase-isomerase QueA [Candidatus Omnitrophota bacterium]
MRLSDFDYALPQDLIAQYPLQERDQARLLVVDRKTSQITHDIFRNIGKYVPDKSLFVINNSKVIPARLLGEKARTGGLVEVFLLKQVDECRFEAMLKPLKKIRVHERLEFPGGICAVLEDKEKRIVRFENQGVLKSLEKFGHIPLPPYIQRPDEDSDRTNYQTVYAKEPGSVASPTAGLHFTKPLISELKKAGHDFAEVTLHVNYGTFKPVEVEDIVSHPMHFEEYDISREIQARLSKAREKGQSVIAVGTTSCRTLEAFARTKKVKDLTSLFLYPGGNDADFRMTDILVTNFHLPKTTLLMLVSAFAGMNLVRKAYQTAIREKYRFYSYGDAMIII